MRDELISEVVQRMLPYLDNKQLVNLQNNLNLVLQRYDVELIDAQLFCIDPDDMNYKKLADKVRYFKEDEKGVAAMCKVMEDMRNDTARQTTVNHIRDIMTNLKLTVEQAMDALNIPESQRNTYIGLIGKKIV